MPINSYCGRAHLTHRYQQQRGGDAPIKTTNTVPLAPPAPILPKSTKKLKLLDIDPLELGRQLTLMEAALYKKIRPMECLQRSREAKPGKTADNITTIIQLSNRVRLLVERARTVLMCLLRLQTGWRSLSSLVRIHRNEHGWSSILSMSLT